MSRNPNPDTIAAYDAHAAAYAARTPSVVSGALREWIDRAVAAVAPASTVLEIGSGTGRDADYLERAGLRVQRSDASTAFVDALRAAGHGAVVLDALSDELGGPWDMVFADAVILHFTRPQVNKLLAKIHRALRPGGVLAFSVKAGRGDGWSSEKLGAPRFFCYWDEEQLWDALVAARFSAIEIVRDAISPQPWLMVIARA